MRDGGGGAGLARSADGALRRRASRAAAPSARRRVGASRPRPGRRLPSRLRRCDRRCGSGRVCGRSSSLRVRSQVPPTGNTLGSRSWSHGIDRARRNPLVHSGRVESPLAGDPFRGTALPSRPNSGGLTCLRKDQHDLHVLLARTFRREPLLPALRCGRGCGFGRSHTHVGASRRFLCRSLRSRKVHPWDDARRPLSGLSAEIAAVSGSRVATELYANSTHQHGNGGHRWKWWTEKWAPFPKNLETAPQKVSLIIRWS